MKSILRLCYLLVVLIIYSCDSKDLNKAFVTSKKVAFRTESNLKAISKILDSSVNDTVNDFTFALSEHTDYFSMEYNQDRINESPLENTYLPRNVEEMIKNEFDFDNIESLMSLNKAYVSAMVSDVFQFHNQVIYVCYASNDLKFRKVHFNFKFVDSSSDFIKNVKRNKKTIIRLKNNLFLKFGYTESININNLK
jgi:hypothetical protein